MRGYIRTANGAHTATVVTDHLDSVARRDAVVAELRGVGLSSPAIEVENVDAIERHPETAKFRRFIRLA